MTLANTIQNSSFEEGFDFWDRNPADDCTRIKSDDHHTGCHAVWFGHGGPPPGSGDYWIEQRLRWPVSPTEDLSLWLKGANPAVPAADIKVYFLHGHSLSEPYRITISAPAWTMVSVPTPRSSFVDGVRIESITSIPFYVDDVCLRGMTLHPALGRAWPAFDDSGLWPIPPAGKQADPAGSMPMLPVIRMLEDRLIGIQRHLRNLENAMLNLKNVTPDDKPEKPET
jgi:hypothetical protein